MTKAERLSHWGILLIGISALIVSVWQVQLSRAHNRLSVRPYLRFNSSNVNFAVEDRFRHELTLSNSGQGPAIIRSLEHTVDKKTTRSITDAMAWAGLEGNIGQFLVTTFDPGDVIEEKTRVTLLGMNDLSPKTKTIHVKITYESLYEEEFTVEMDY